MKLFKVDLMKELENSNRGNLQAELDLAKEETELASLKQLQKILEAESENDIEYLRSLGLLKFQEEKLNKAKLRIESIKKKMSQRNYSLREIRELALRYDLRFVDLENYIGTLPTDFVQVVKKAEDDFIKDFLEKKKDMIVENRKVKMPASLYNVFDNYLMERYNSENNIKKNRRNLSVEDYHRIMLSDDFKEYENQILNKHKEYMENRYYKENDPERIEYISNLAREKFRSNLKILAPIETLKTNLVKFTPNLDPILFLSTDNGYVFIKKWGEDFTTARLIRGFFKMHPKIGVTTIKIISTMAILSLCLFWMLPKALEVPAGENNVWALICIIGFIVSGISFIISFTASSLAYKKKVIYYSSWNNAKVYDESTLRNFNVNQIEGFDMDSTDY